MNWFPREYLGLVGMAMWGITMGLIALGPDWIAKRHERRERQAAATAAQESHPKSAE